jgi:hypothetical protein
MAFHVLLSGGAKFHGNKLETLLLKSGDNFSYKSSLNSIRLEHNKSAFFVRVRLSLYLDSNSGGNSSSILCSTSLFDLLNLS